MQLSSCYFCGTALDAPVEEYRVIPDDLAPDDDRTVTLCPTCRRKLAAVVGAVVETTDAPGATTLSDFEGGVTDGSDGARPLYDPDAPVPGAADAGRAADEGSPVTPPEPGDERSDRSDASGGDGHDPNATEATDEGDSGAAESESGSGVREGSGTVSSAPEGDDASDEIGGDAAEDGTEATGENADPVEETGDEADSAVGSAGDATDPADSTGEQTDDESGATGRAADRPGGAVNGDSEGAETAGGARSSDTDSGGHPDSGDEGASDATGGAATEPDETDGSDSDERATTDTDGESGAGEAGDSDQPQVLSTPAAKKVIRLLQNREFPVDREEFQVVAANAYDLSHQDCAAVVDALVEGGYVAEENGTLVRPAE